MAGPAPADLRATGGAVAIERDVVLVHGPEAVAFLQGQLSQDVEALAVGASAPSLLLQPTGKVDAWLRVTRTAQDALLLDVDAGWGDAVLTRLRRFQLRTKAELEQERWSGFALRGPGAAEAGASAATAGTVVLPAPWAGVDAVDLLAPAGVADPGLPIVGHDALEGLRVEQGIPALGAEANEGTIPAELGQWLIDASVSFTKGCYTGQELVARIDSRGGNVPHPVRGLVLDGPAAAAVAVGAAVSVDGAEVGRITSVARSATLGPVALAVLGRGVAPGSEVSVAAGGDDAVPAQVRELPLR